MKCTSSDELVCKMAVMAVEMQETPILVARIGQRNEVGSQPLEGDIGTSPSFRFSCELPGGEFCEVCWELLRLNYLSLENDNRR